MIVDRTETKRRAKEKYEIEQKVDSNSSYLLNRLIKPLDKSFQNCISRLTS